jgi:hypothetical protein
MDLSKKNKAIGLVDELSSLFKEMQEEIDRDSGQSSSELGSPSMKAQEYTKIISGAIETLSTRAVNIIRNLH